MESELLSILASVQPSGQSVPVSRMDISVNYACVLALCLRPGGSVGSFPTDYLRQMSSFQASRSAPHRAQETIAARTILYLCGCFRFRLLY